MSYKTYSAISITAMLMAMGCFCMNTFQPKQWHYIIYFLPDITLEDVMYYNITCIGWMLISVSSYYMASIVTSHHKQSQIVNIARNLFSTTAILFAIRAGFQFFIYEKWTQAEMICHSTILFLMTAKTIYFFIANKPHKNHDSRRFD